MLYNIFRPITARRRSS